jgi:hypothetical protein|tara:strand:+ start:242 stop:511 length:270 start_codon:yes stop_codon:yes gene_type:complete
MIDRLFDDTLWIYTSIIGALAGAAFLAYFKDTHAGIYCYAKLDQILDYLVDRWGWTWLQQPEDVWRKKYPKITKKIDEIERRLDALDKK